MGERPLSKEEREAIKDLGAGWLEQRKNQRECHICRATTGLYDCDSCGQPACEEHTSSTVAYGMDWTGCHRCRRIEV